LAIHAVSGEERCPLVLFVDVIVSAPGAQLAAFLDRSKKGRPSQKRVNNIDL
jgi:hypothetical protein